MMTIAPALSPFNDPRHWGPSDWSCPLSPEEVAAFQTRIDAIAGLTRDNQSIMKLVWSADKTYWRDICINWDTVGKPIEFIKRPILLYRSVFDPNGKLMYDIPPPRWLLLTRIEPEQYAATWARDARAWIPERNQYVQLKPETPPENGWYVWFMTIADHDPWCCPQAAEEERTCYGLYAGPEYGIAELIRTRDGMESSEYRDTTAPFDSPDRLSRKLRERGVNNYTEQAMRAYQKQVSSFIDSIPIAQLRDLLTQDLNRDLDDMDAKGV